MKDELSFVKKRRQDILADGFAQLALHQQLMLGSALRKEPYNVWEALAVEGFAVALGFAEWTKLPELCNRPTQKEFEDGLNRWDT